MSDGEVSSLQEQLHMVITEEFLRDFKFADRYYEKNELMEKLAKIKERIEKKVLEVVKQHRTPRKKELLLLWKKHPEVSELSVLNWRNDFEIKLEAFVDGCVCKEELQKVLQSKNLAYETMEKGYIQLAKKLAKLQKLIQDFPSKKSSQLRINEYRTPEIDVWLEKLKRLRCRTKKVVN